MRYGPFRYKGYTVKTYTPNIEDSILLIKWALDNDSDGLFHYFTDLSDVDYIVWKFEKEEDATIFALKFI